MTDCMRILVATASGNLQSLMSRMLRRIGYSIEPVSSAAEALEAAQHSDYRAIVADMHLPDRCGATLVDRLRKAGVDTPAILLVEEETPRVRAAAHRLSATRCLTCPSPDELREALWAASGETPPPPPGDDEPV